MFDLIVFLLDKSASMESLTSDTIGGFNRFLAEQKALPAEAKFTLVLFATNSELIYNNKNLQNVPSLDEKLYVANGMSTAYLDAIGQAIDETGAYLAKMKEHNRPRKVIFVTLTDGMENASREYSRDDILERITHQTNKYNWEFIFLGANMDAVKEGTSLGVSAGNSINFVANAAGVRSAYSQTSQRVSQSRT